MHRTVRATPRVFTAFAFSLALCLPAAALAAQFDFYIKLPPIEGDSGKAASHGGEIEIQSWSWGATQTSGAGLGSGKVSMQDISAPSATSGKREKGGTEDINIGVGELQESGEAEITLKGSKIGENAPATRTPPTVTLKRGSASVNPYNPKELTISKGVGWHTGQPAPSGSVTVRGKFPSCTVGTRYPSLELGSRGTRYKLHNAVVTSCGGSDGGQQPMEEISFNYMKIDF